MTNSRNTEMNQHTSKPLQAMVPGTRNEENTKDAMMTKARWTDQGKADRRIQIDGSRVRSDRDNGAVSRCEVSGGEKGVGSTMNQRNTARLLHLQNSSLRRLPPSSPPERDSAKDEKEPRSTDPRKEEPGAPHRGRCGMVVWEWGRSSDQEISSYLSIDRNN